MPPALLARSKRALKPSSAPVNAAAVNTQPTLIEVSVMPRVSPDPFGPMSGSLAAIALMSPEAADAVVVVPPEVDFLLLLPQAAASMPTTATSAIDVAHHRFMPSPLDQLSGTRRCAS